MSDRDIQAKIDARIRAYQSDLCARVNAGEITDEEANVLAADFADRMYLVGPWS